LPIIIPAPKLENGNTLFYKKSALFFKTGLGKRESNNQTESSEKQKQFFIELEAMHSFYLNSKHTINLKTQNYYLQSSNYLNNELYRFGGVNSIRGFIENSLSANLMTAIITEYRYIVSPSVYFHTILDYCWLQDTKTTKKTTNLLGLGIGFGVQTPNGILKISMAHGGVQSQKINFYNTIIHISYNVKF
jgi:hemolysin activation/secretion protein